MENKKYQNAWDTVLRQKSNISEVKNIIGMPKETIEMYQSFVQTHYQEALEKMFPRLHDITSIDWLEISQIYFEKYPPYAWDLNDLTKSFPSFIQQIEDEYKLPPYIKELVRFELIEFYVYKHRGHRNKKLSELQINPTLQVEQFHYDIASWVKKLDVLEDAEDYDAIKRSMPNKRTNFLAVARNFETNLCVFTQIGGVELAIIEILKEVNELEQLVSLIKEFIPKATNEHIQNSIELLKKQRILI